MQNVDPEIDDRLFRNAMGCFTTGVTIITTEVDGNVIGMTANAIMSVSLKPKLLAISIGENAKMLPHLQQAKKFAVNILGDDQQELSRYFAGQLKEKKELTFPYFNGLPIIQDAHAVITCNVQNELLAGDHTIFIGEATGISIEEKKPLVFYRGKYCKLNEE